MIARAQKKSGFDETYFGLIVIPSCDGCHAFHKECVLNHFESMKKDNSKVNFYQCIVCKKTCGNRTGGMPPGTMKWRRERYTILPGTGCKDGAIVIDYRFDGGYLPNKVYYRGD